MKLDKLVLVNWGQLRPGNFDMGDMTLLTGETGSGKSTMLDALQTIMTAAYSGILNYNPGQDEVSQGQRRGKTRRTLESYIVGAEYNRFSRKDGAQGFMAAVFRPSKGEQLPPFTALVAASARVEGNGESRHAKLENLDLIIVDEAMLSFEDFLKDESTHECIPVERIARHLAKKYKGVQNFHDKKMDYLCALYGRFRGKNSVTRNEASYAAKAWVQSIAYRPIGSVHELVRNEILDFDEKQLQQDIERISGLMRQVSHLRQESIRLQTNVTRLNTLKTTIAETCQAYEHYVTQSIVVAQLQSKNNDSTLHHIRKKIASNHKAIDKENAQVGNWNTLLERLDNQRVDLYARLHGIPVHHKKQELETTLRQATASIKMGLQTWQATLMSVAKLEQEARQFIATALPPKCSHLKKIIEHVASTYHAIDFSRFAKCHEKMVALIASQEIHAQELHELILHLNTIDAGIDDLYDVLIESENSVLNITANEIANTLQAKQRSDELVRDLAKQKAQLAQGKIPYPRQTQLAVELINAYFPAANVQVLCDLIEPRSDQWQAAIESYLANARFNLIVDPSSERACIDLLKTKHLSAKIIQGALCLDHAKHRTLSKESIVHELTSDNPIAWAYLVEQYGSVVKVADTEALRNIPRGLTVNSIASASRTMFTCEKTELVFGQKAREMTLLRVISELEIAEKEADAWAHLKDTLDTIKSTLQILKRPCFDIAPLSEVTHLFEKTQQSLSALDITELKQLENNLENVVAEIKEYTLNIQAAQHRLGTLDATNRSSQNTIQELEKQAQTHILNHETQLAKLKELSQINPALIYPKLIEEIESRLASSDIDIEEAKRTLTHLSHAPDHLLVNVRENLLEYNSQAKTDERFTITLLPQHEADTFDANYHCLVELTQAVNKMLEGLRSIGLYNNRLELDSAEKSFHDVFTKQFCVEIKSRVDEGIRTLRQINAELKNLKFGNDSFTIDWSRWEPEFEDYLSFFEAVAYMADAAEPMNLFEETQLSKKHEEIRDRLVHLLLDEDQERASKELLRIADYRNYRRYDIINTTSNGGRVKLSEWGTGSGGQLETPAYIVRAAVVTNRLKLFEKSPSLKLLVNDESFSKMDETRARAVLSFLRDRLDLQIISAMPTMKAGALKDEFNREYSFTRLTPVENGELDFISECDERIFKTDRMRQLWEQQRQFARETAKQLFEQTPSAEDTSRNVMEKA